jgi:AcrR family transcriptional regulator
MAEAALVPAGRRERKKEETKRRIFEAALTLFNEKGFDATTIDDITGRADVAKGTFFNYFPRKEAVIEYLADEWMEVAEEAAADRDRPATDRVRALYAVLTRAHEEHPDLSRAVMRASAQRMCCPAPGGAWQRFEQLVIEVVRQGQTRGELRRDRKPELLHGVLMSCFVGGVMWWLGERASSPDVEIRSVTLQQVVAAMQDVALDGMRVERGAA